MHAGRSKGWYMGHSTYIILEKHGQLSQILVDCESKLGAANARRDDLKGFSRNIPTSKKVFKVVPFTKDINPCSELDQAVAILTQKLQGIAKLNQGIAELDESILAEIKAEKRRNRNLIMFGIFLVIILGIVLFFQSQKSNTPVSTGANTSSVMTSKINLGNSNSDNAISGKSNSSATKIPIMTSVSENSTRDLILGTNSEAQTAWENKIKELEDVAIENYSDAERSIPGKKLIYTIILKTSEPLLFTNRWCATHGKTLSINKGHIKFSNIIFDNALPEHVFGYSTYQTNSGTGWMCYAQFALIKSWPSGKTILTTRKVIESLIDDGQTQYSPGVLDREFHVTVG